ncbi:MAG TPA: hypothetical protein VFI49_01950 [Rudaea sp.]|nr:hypothetical protein [Rudaea sp.]
MRARAKRSLLYAGLMAIAAAPLAAAVAGNEHGVRFNTAGVLDLAERSQTVANGRAVPAAELPATDAQEIFAAQAVGENELPLRFSDDVFGCAKPSRQCSTQHERALIDASGGAVRREGKRLTVVAADGQAATFVDWKQPTTKTADGDEETHWYLGRMPKNGYQRVEVEFGHDAPGNFLINPQSGKTAFVHNAADLVAPSPDERLLVTFNSLNPPISIRVAALDAAGPRLVLQCQAPESVARLTPVFKGWHDATALDLVFEIGEQSKSMQRLAVRLVRRADGWHLEASDAARLERVGLTCRQDAAAPQ